MPRTAASSEACHPASSDVRGEEPPLWHGIDFGQPSSSNRTRGMRFQAAKGPFRALRRGHMALELPPKLCQWSYHGAVFRSSGGKVTSPGQERKMAVARTKRDHRVWLA